MREIKFEYGFNSVNGIVKKVYSLSAIPFMHVKCDVWNILPIAYVRQFTGLKDKNGVEIYEWDILKSPSGHKGVAVFENFTWGIKDKLNKIGGLNPFSNMQLEHWTIIGNIHSNPELLNNDR